MDKRRIVTRILMLLAVLALCAAQAAAATINVPGDYATIQAAINAASPGDTIQIAPGTYAESLDINKTLTIVGAGSGTNPLVDTIIDPVTGYGMYIHQPVNLKDLRVTGATQGIRIQSVSGRLNFSGATWENIASSGNSERGVEIHNGTDVSSMVIRDSEFVSNPQHGIRSASDVTVAGLVITDCSFNQNAYGLYLQGTINNLEIAGSFFNDNTQWGLYMSETGPISNVTVENSHFEGNASWGAVLWTGSSAGISGVSVSRSSFDNLSGRGFWAGADVLADVNLACNWWGAADGPGPVGPGTGNQVSEGATFAPWLTGDDLSNAACYGGPARSIKQLVAIDLDILAKDQSVDKKVRSKVKEALKHLQKSLNGKLWVDDSTLTSKGQKVFEEEKHAVQKLRDIKNPSSLILDAIDALVGADDTLARHAVALAQANLGADGKYLAKAYDELAKADGYLTVNPEKAIEHYKKAWQHATKAVRKPVSPDFATFYIRNNNGTIVPPWDADLKITENVGGDGFSAETPRSGQKVGYGTDFFDDEPIRAIESVNWDKVSGKNGVVAYLNIWVTDGVNFAIISSENDYRGTSFHTSREWKVFETNFSNLSWLCDNGPGTRDSAQYLVCNGARVTFADLASDLTILSPTTYAAPIGTGAPRAGYGFNLMFGDTQSNFIGSYHLENLSVTAGGVTYFAR